MGEPMKKLPLFNAVIAHVPGDGFRDELPKMVTETDLVITNQKTIEFRYNCPDCKAFMVVQPRHLHRVNSDIYDRVIVDVRLPEEDTDEFEAIKEVCRDRIVIFTKVSMGDQVQKLLTLAKSLKVGYMPWEALGEL